MTGTGPIDRFADDFDFLSNFFDAAVRLDGQWYPTVEHAFQAAKTADATERARVRAAGSPGVAKRVGRKVTLRADWESVKVSIMEALVRQKFEVHADLKEKLLATGERELIEGNTWNDTFWGRSRGHGKNHLGKILMRVREALRLGTRAAGHDVR